MYGGYRIAARGGSDCSTEVIGDARWKRARSPSEFTPNVGHDTEGVRPAKTWPSAGSQLGFSGIWKDTDTGIWFHNGRCLGALADRR
jgi:hypothetical protein